MPISISEPMTIRGVDSVAFKLKQISRRSKAIPPRTWQGIGAYLSRMANQQFVTNGARLGTPWEPLNPKYKAWKASHGYSTRILRMTGEMRETFVGRPMEVERYYKHVAYFGSRNKKAIWNHRGTVVNGQPHSPARPILNVTEEIENEVASRIAKYLMGKR